MKIIKEMTTNNLVGLMASILGIFGFMISLREELNRAIKTLNLPPEVNFYFLFFWAFIAWFLGGLLWIGLNRLNDKYNFMGNSAYTGGPNSEPHGLGAIIWSISTTIFSIITLILLNNRYKFIENQVQLLIYTAFIVGISMGSVIFYDLPICGNKGFRNYFNTKKLTYFSKEFWLVVIWSSLISIFGFLFANIVKVVALPISKGLVPTAYLFLKQIGICVGLTTCVVTFFLIVFPSQPRFEAAKGIIAGLFLRTTLFFGLLFFGKI